MSQQKTGRKRIFLQIALCIGFFVFAHEQLRAQYDQYLEFVHLYTGCVDDEESTIYGGTYKNKWPADLNLPVFPGGGDIELSRFVYHNIEYPTVIDSVTPATDSTSEKSHLAKGIVYVQVVVDRCGKATRQEVVQSVNPQYDEEAMRIMRNLPVFKAGAIDGIRVKVALVIPVYFMRDEPKKRKTYMYNGEELYDDDDDTKYYDNSSNGYGNKNNNNGNNNDNYDDSDQNNNGTDDNYNDADDSGRNVQQ